jgi:hypothetical protein
LSRSAQLLLPLLLTLACSGEAPPDRRAASGALDGLARCLTERGVVYYGASGCRACRAQERTFGAAFAHIRGIECHPHAPGAEPERCVERGIRVTPTWLLEPGGREAGRLEGARTHPELAELSGCPWRPASPSRP